MSSVSGDTQPEEARIFLDSEERGVMGSGKRTLSVRTILRAWGTSREMITKPEALFKRSTCSRGLTTLDQPQHHSTPQPGTVASAHNSGEAEAGKQSVVGREVLSYWLRDRYSWSSIPSGERVQRIYIPQ